MPHHQPSPPAVGELIRYGMCSVRSGHGHPIGSIYLISTSDSQWGNWACWGMWLVSLIWWAYRADLPNITAQCVSACCCVKESVIVATGINLLSVKENEFSVRSLCWSAVALPFANLLTWPWTNSPGSEQKTASFEERQMFFTPSSFCSSASFVEHPLIVLSIEGAPGVLCLGKLHIKEVANWVKNVQRRKAVSRVPASSLGGKNWCLSSRRGEYKVITKPTYFCCSKGHASEVVGKSSRV